ncbi:MAG: hypothetical protein LWW93_10655 [Hyphomicrobiales bacterium]|nr:hypothetical protein [Hyphomicrobiales bacterium]
MTRAPRPPTLAVRIASAFTALVALTLFSALVVRSTETWITADPVTTHRLLDLLAERRSLIRAWETAGLGEARFALDAEIRATGAHIAELDATMPPPRRVHGLAPWRSLLADLPHIAPIVVELAGETCLSLAVAFAFGVALTRLGPRARFVVLTLAIAPLGLPPPLWASAFVRLAAVFGLPPSDRLADVAEIFVGMPFALILGWVATRRIDPRRLEAARDLGLSIRERIVHVSLPAVAPGFAIAGVVVFARLLDDLAIARLIGASDAGHRFGAWMRHRIVAGVDFPTAAAGALLAGVVAVAIAAPLVGLAVRSATPPPTVAPRWPWAERGRPIGPALIWLTPFVLIAAIIGVVALQAAVAGFDLRAERFVVATEELLRAGLAGLLAFLAAIALVLAFDPAEPNRRRAAAAVLAAAAALPAPTVAFAVRLFADDLGVEAGAWIATLAAAVAAVGLPAALLLLGRAPREPAGSVAPPARREALLRRLVPLAPLAAVLAVVRALAAADLGTIVGLVDRTALFDRPAALADPAAAVGIVSALAIGLVGAWATERARTGGV